MIIFKFDGIGFYDACSKVKSYLVYGTPEEKKSFVDYTDRYYDINDEVSVTVMSHLVVTTIVERKREWVYSRKRYGYLPEYLRFDILKNHREYITQHTYESRDLIPNTQSREVFGQYGDYPESFLYLIKEVQDSTQHLERDFTPTYDDYFNNNRKILSENQLLFRNLSMVRMPYVGSDSILIGIFGILFSLLFFGDMSDYNSIGIYTVINTILFSLSLSCTKKEEWWMLPLDEFEVKRKVEPKGIGDMTTNGLIISIIMFLLAIALPSFVALCLWMVINWKYETGSAAAMAVFGSIIYFLFLMLYIKFMLAFEMEVY